MDSVKLVDVKKVVEGKVKTTRSTKSKTGCNGCGLQGSTYVPPEDVGEPKFLVVGEAPGKTEAKQLRPFIGESGQLLRQVLSKVGYGYRILNVANCLPLDKDGMIRQPSPAEIERCMPQFVLNEIKKFDIVLLVGGVAVNAVFSGGKKVKKDESPQISISEVSGSVLVSKGRKYICVLHPAYILRNISSVANPSEKDRKLINDWVNDVMRVRDVIDKIPLPFEIQICMGSNIDVAKKVLEKSEYLVVDCETSSLDTDNCILYSLSVSGLDGAIFTCEDQSLLKDLSGVFDGKVIVMHNAAFDYKVLYNKGLKLDKNVILDTMLLASVIDEQRRFSSYKLKELVRKYLGYKYSRLIIDLSDLSQESAQEVREYNAEDVYATRNLFKFFIEKVLTDKQIDFSKRVLSNAVKVVAEIEMNGIMIDENSVGQVLDKCVERIDTLGKSLIEKISSFGPEFKAISITSPKQLGEFLGQVLVMQNVAENDITGNEVKMFINEFLNSPAFKTKTGRMAVNEGSITRMIEKFDSIYEKYGVEIVRRLAEILRTLLEYREYDKLKGTFLKSFMQHLGKDKRVHSSYSLIGTRTGRLSSYSPNLQNIPHDLRSVFVAKPGYVFIEADLSQIELRVAAVIAKDEVMMEAYKQGRDLHKLTASAISGVPEEAVTDEMRQGAKAGNFGLIYGMQWRSFKEYAKGQYGVIYTDDEAQRVHKRFFELYRGVAQWHKDTKEFVKEFGYSESPFGRIYTFDSGDDLDSVVRRAVNYPVQGTASDLNMYIMGKIFEWKIEEGLDSTFVGTVHDSMLIEVLEEVADKVIEKVKEITHNLQKDFSWLTVPVEIDVGKDYKW